MEKDTRKKIIRVLKVFLLLYAIIGIAWYYGQEKLIFHPVPVDRKIAYHFAQPFAELNIPYDAVTNLNVLEFRATDRPADSPARGVALFFHGDKENSSAYAAAAADFTAKGYELWLLDYPGYGKSTGPLSEKKLYEQALIFYKLARSRWQPSQIIIYGMSLGTGIAAELASVRDCRRLILESPFYGMTYQFRRFFFLYPVETMLHYHFPVYSYLPAVTAPITIFHGSSDRVVPTGEAADLKQFLKKGDEFVTLPGAKHDNIRSFPIYQQKLDSVLAL